MEVQEYILAAFPEITTEEIGSITARLNELGVNKTEDLHFVIEDDLAGVLKPVQIRKLLKMWVRPTENVGISMQPVIIEYSQASSSNIDASTDIVQLPQLNVSNKSLMIPWENFPPEIAECCRRKARPQKKNLLQMVRILVAEIAKTNTHPGRASFRAIASEIVNTYPDSFQDQCCGSIIAGGYMSLMKRMENCIDNGNRRIPYIRTCNPVEKSTSMKKKYTDSYGCINWQPEELPEGETLETQQEKKMWLISEFPKKERDEIKVETYMNLTYYNQRTFINENRPSPTAIKNEWPFLTEAKHLMIHCQELLGVSIEERITASVSIKGRTIYDYMTMIKGTNSKISRCLKEIGEAKRTLGSNQPEIYSCIDLLMDYFGEKKDELFQINMQPVCDSEVEGRNAPNTPYIATSGGNIYNATKFAVVFEKSVLGYTNGFPSAVAMLFGCYYVFNIEYPQAACTTLEFIQRCFADINPKRGSKSRRGNAKGYNCHPKVLQLANELRDFESSWSILKN